MEKARAPLFSFSFMQWATMTTKRVMGPQYIWGAQPEKYRKTIDAKWVEENAQKLDAFEGQQLIVLVPDTKEYNHMTVHRNFQYRTLLEVLTCLLEYQIRIVTRKLLPFSWPSPARLLFMFATILVLVDSMF